MVLVTSEGGNRHVLGGVPRPAKACIRFFGPGKILFQMCVGLGTIIEPNSLLGMTTPGFATKKSVDGRLAKYNMCRDWPESTRHVRAWYQPRPSVVDSIHEQLNQ